MTGLTPEPAAHRGPRLLVHHPLVRTSDPAEVMRAVSAAVLPHTLSLLDRERRFAATVNFASLGRMSIHYSRYEAPVEIDLGELQDGYVLTHFLKGHFAVGKGQEQRLVRRGDTVVLSPDLGVKYSVLESPCAAITLLVPRRTLHDYLSRYLDLPVARPIHFTLDRPAGDPALKSLVQFLYWTCLQLDDEYSLLSRGHTARETEDLILAQLIRLEGHSYTEWVQRERPVPAPGFVRRVEDYIQARAGDEITMDDLVEVSGVSASTLFRGFRRFRGMGPMAYLKQVRLDRAREDLIRSDHRETTVTAIATRWRLFHLGNFAADYTRRFGEAPSATLRAAPNAKR